MKRNIKKIITIPFILLFLISCELVDTKIPVDKSAPTRSVRYVVQMTSSSANSNPKITYTNAAGGTTQTSSLSMDLTVAVDSGTTAFLSASCNGYYSPLAGNSSAAVDIQLFIGDSLAADSTIIESDNFTTVNASASVSADIN